MWLKVLTSGFLAAGVAMLLFWVKLIGPKPAKGATDKQLAEYGIRLLTYFGVTCILFLATAICAILLIRRARREFLEDMRGNYEDLVEGTLQDHGRKD